MVTKTMKSSVSHQIIYGINISPFIKTIPFICGIIFTVSFVMVREFDGSIPFYNTWSLGVIALTLGFAVYFSYFHEIAVPPSRLIISVLETLRVSLGTECYRVNIMEPRDYVDINNTHFYIQFATSNVYAPQSYDGKFNVQTQGVGKAFTHKETTFISGSQIDKSLDTFPEAIWSIPIKTREGDIVGVLNIDTCRKPSCFTEDDVERIKHVGQSVVNILVPRFMQ